MNKTYPVSCEISGPAAMFTRPDSGSSFVSYPAPTYSACCGILSSVAWMKTAFIRPVKVHICRPIVYHRYCVNYNGPLRKDKSFSDGNPYQYYCMILIDVCYQIFGEADVIEPTDVKYKPYLESHNNKHHIQDLFNRRLKQGRLHSTPFLGQKEFTPDYFGPLRPESQPDESINETINSMLLRVFDKDAFGKVNPTFRQDVKIENGVLIYPK
ncbi:MAG: CRISPR-associated protein Cas5 [Thermoguttaceae bacterium]|nr:CRISPR-associated protein Cas5 [Thermoguttaceae bacterium]MBQ6617644.1 CRISPR-associated protein Cas5 [Thermoguttaceae bacterium]